MIIAPLILALFTSLSLCITAITAYLLLVTCAAYFFRKKVQYGGRPLKLAVVIPAHNEEECIGETIRRLNESDYERRLFTIVVIADNCEDRTEERARAAGATVFRRTDAEERGKGQALDWFYRHHRHAYGWADAIIMIDSDTTVDRQFLREMAASLSHPSVTAVQGYYGVSNPGEHWRSALVSAAFHVFNHLRPAGITRLGGTAGLRGNGMGFRKELLVDGWPAHSIVEDFEFTLHLLLRGVVVHYNPDALVFSGMPTDAKSAKSQRMRWEGMDRRTLSACKSLVLGHFVRRPRVRLLHALLGFFVPPFAKIVVGQVTLLIAALILSSKMAAPLIVCLAVDLFYVFSGLLLRGASSAEWLSLLRAPRYVVWKLGIYIRMIDRRPTGWERTKRPAELRAGGRGSSRR